MIRAARCVMPRWSMPRPRSPAPPSISTVRSRCSSTQVPRTATSATVRRRTRRLPTISTGTPSGRRRAWGPTRSTWPAPPRRPLSPAPNVTRFPRPSTTAAPTGTWMPPAARPNCSSLPRLVQERQPHERPNVERARRYRRRVRHLPRQHGRRDDRPEGPAEDGGERRNAPELHAVLDVS